eukprot:1129102-Prymnesium_polylepis.1
MGGFGRFRALWGDFPLKTAQNRAGNPKKRCPNLLNSRRHRIRKFLRLQMIRSEMLRHPAPTAPAGRVCGCGRGVHGPLIMQRQR